MGLARKIEDSELIGYVYCEKMGVLRCANMHDKKQFYALAQLIHKAVNIGAIAENNRGFQLCAKTRPAEKEAFQVVLRQIRLNLEFRQDRLIYDLLSKQLRNKVIYLSLGDINGRLLPKLAQRPDSRRAAL